jgi:hypothetical protein
LRQKLQSRELKLVKPKKMFGAEIDNLIRSEKENRYVNKKLDNQPRFDID